MEEERLMEVKRAEVLVMSSTEKEGVVMDCLLNSALTLEKEVGKDVGPDIKVPQGKESKASKAGKSALFGTLQVFDTLLKVSDQLAPDATDETAATAGHTHGKDVGVTARQRMSVGGDIFEIKDMVGKKAVGKLAAKGAMYIANGIVEGTFAKSQSGKAGKGS